MNLSSPEAAHGPDDGRVSPWAWLNARCRVARPAQVASGIMAASLGFVVAVAWLTGAEALTRVHPLFPPMSYGAALGLLVCGLALLTAAGGWRRLAGAIASVVLLLGLTTFSEYGLDVGWNLHQALLGDLGGGLPVGMAPSTALSLVLVGLGLLAVSLHPHQGSLVCAISGTTVAAQSGMAFLWYGLGFDGLSVVTDSAPHVSAGLAVVGIGTLASAWDRSHASTSGAPRWLPLPVALGMALISVSLWNQSESDRRATIEGTTRLRAERVGADLNRRASPLTASLVRLARAESSRLDLQTAVDTRLLAALDLERQSGLLGIGMVDSSFEHRWVVTEDPKPPLDLHLDGRARAILVEAGVRHVPAVVDPARLPSGDTGFLIAVPVVNQAQIAGFIIAWCRYEEFFLATIGEEVGSEYYLRVFSGQREVYRHGSLAAPDEAFMAAAAVPFLGTQWRAQVWPRSVEGPRRSLADRTLVFGLLVAGLLGLTVQLGQWSVRNRNKLTHMNSDLQSAIAARHAAQAAHAENEVRYKHIVDAAADVIYRTDVKGRFTFVNPAAIRVTKWSREDLIGRDYLSLIRPDYRDAVRTFYWKQAEERTPTTYLDFPIVTPDGQEIWIGQHVQRLTEGERLVGFQAVARDISERMRVQHELQRMRDAALEATRLKSEFVANTSHEIRTPLNGVVGYASLLLDTNLDEQQRSYADGLRLSADALLSVVNDILDFSKIEAGMLRLDTMSFDLRATLDDSIGIFSESTRQKGLALDVEVDAAVPRRVNGDPSRLRQVLTNLISNAIKFTDRGSIVVGVSVEADAGSQIVVRFSIRDSGVGIDQELQDKLFQPFVQGDGSTSRRHGGTGLGLAISRQIVQLMGGSIGVESVPGAGSTFHFTAKFGKDAQHWVAAGPPASLERVRLLVVADPSNFREELVAQARGWGMAVSTAETGAHARTMLRMAAAEGRPHAAALLCLVHPNADALVLARAITSDPELMPPPKLILIPPKGILGEAREAHDHGIAAYLPRPVDSEDLRQCLLSVVSGDTDGPNQRETSVLPLVTRHSLHEQRLASGVRILVADDNPVTQQVTRLLIEKLGYSVEIVGNGLEAVRAAAACRYALILMDCQMPTMDGYTATAEIRRAEGEGRHTPIVAFTASGNPGERERCHAAGMDDVLEKPLRNTELVEALDRWTRGRSSGGSTAAATRIDPAPGGVVVDEAAIAALEEHLGGADILNQMTARLVDHAGAVLGRMEQLLDDQHVDGLAREAHRLRGGALTLGFVRLGQSCATLEDTALDVAASDRKRLVDHVRQACVELSTWHSERLAAPDRRSDSP